MGANRIGKAKGTPILIILKNAVEPTQRRKGAETQGFRLVVGAITHWVSYANLFFPGHLPVPGAFASGRLGVNCRC